MKRPFDYRRGPSGATFLADGDRWCVTAPVSRPKIALLLVPVLSVITILAGIAAYQMLFQPEQVRFKGGDPLYDKIIFFSLMVPLLLVFWCHGLMMLGGRVVVRAKRDRGTVFVGVGPLGVYRFFRTSNVRRIWIDGSQLIPDHQYGTRICIEGKRTIRFGAALSKEARTFVLKCLVEMLLKELRQAHNRSEEPSLDSLRTEA